MKRLFRPLLAVFSLCCIAVFSTVSVVLSASDSLEEILDHEVMRTALFTLAPKSQLEDKLGGTNYSQLILEHLVNKRPELNQFVERITANTINLDYITQRSQVIDKLLDNILDQTSPPRTLIALAAGFDSRPLRYKHRFDEIYEVDFPAIIAEKKHSYQQLDIGHHHRLIPGDITQQDWLTSLPKENVLITLEGILPYLDEEQVRSVLLHIASNFRNSHVLLETIPGYMVPTAQLCLRSAFIRWILFQRQGKFQAISAFRSDGRILKPENIPLWASDLPQGRVSILQQVSPVYPMRGIILHLPWLLGADTPLITWMKLN